jgi:hypothetical protein
MAWTGLSEHAYQTIIDFFQRIYDQLTNLSLTALIAEEHMTYEFGIKAGLVVNGNVVEIIRMTRCNELHEWNWKWEADSLVQGILTTLTRDLFINTEYEKVINDEWQRDEYPYPGKDESWI